MPEQLYLNAGTIELDSKRYELVRESGSQLGYMRQFFNETPWEEGAPGIMARRISSWDKGGLHTTLEADLRTESNRIRFLSQSEWGENTDPRWRNRLLPGPRIKSIDTGANTDLITHMWEQPARSINGVFQRSTIWFVAGDKVYVTDNLEDSVVSYNSSSDPPKMGVSWQGENLIVTTTRKIYRRTETVLDTSRPSATGLSAQWTPSAGANWQNVDETTQDGSGTYNAGITAGTIDLFNTSNVTLGASVVSGVSITGYVYANPNQDIHNVIRFITRIGGINYYSDNIIVGSADYAPYTYTWALSPDSGIAWTEAEINAAQFGYELVTVGSFESVPLTTFITQLFINVMGEDWATTDADADWLAVGPRRLFKVYVDATDGVVLKNLEPGLDPTDETNWADEVIIPGVTIDDTIVPLVAFQKTALVATDRGTHAVDIDGSGIRIIERMAWAPRTLAVQDPYLYVSHGHGITRWFPGIAESCGLEQINDNQSGVTGVFTAFAFIGKWVFAALTIPNGNTHILVGRDSDQDDIDGPVVWDTFIDTGTTVEVRYLLAARWAGISPSDASFALFFGTDTTLRYAMFPETGGTPEVDDADYEFVISAIRYTSHLYFGDYRDKNFYKVAIKGLNLTSAIYWEFAYRIDSGAWVTTDRDSVNMRVDDNEITEFYLPTSATGQRIQGRLTYTSNDPDVGGEIEYIEFSSIPQVRRGSNITFLLQLAYQIRHTDSIESRLTLEQFDDLSALVEGAPILSNGPWGELTLSLKELEQIRASQTGQNQVELIVKVVGQVRE